LSPRKAKRIKSEETGIRSNWNQKKNGKPKALGSIALYNGTAMASRHGMSSNRYFMVLLPE
jgi:hypothetical protein